MVVGNIFSNYTYTKFNMPNIEMVSRSIGQQITVNLILCVDSKWQPLNSKLK